MVDKVANPIVFYRRAGGMAGLDQRLTAYEDGRVTLDDRKARAQSEVHATPSEIETLLTLTDSVPANRWQGHLTALARALLPRPHESLRFELRRGSDRIAGIAGSADTDLGPLLAQLDELLARAVRERRA